MIKMRHVRKHCSLCGIGLIFPNFFPSLPKSFETTVAALSRLQENSYRRSAFLASALDLLPPGIVNKAKIQDKSRLVRLPDILVPPEEDDEMIGVGIGISSSTGRGQGNDQSSAIKTGKGETDWKRAGAGPLRVGRYGRWFSDVSIKVESPRSS